MLQLTAQQSFRKLITLAACLLSSTVACDKAPPIAARQTTDEGTLQGKLLVANVEGHGPQAGTKRLLVPDGGGAPIRLKFDQPPEWISGTRVLVHGHQEEGFFRVTDLVVDDDDTIVGRRFLTGQSVQRSRTVAFVEVNINGGGIALPSGSASPDVFMFSTTNAGPTCGIGPGMKSVVQFYNETSYNLFQFSGKVEGPLAWSGNPCPDTGDQLAADLTPKISTKYDHYVWYYGSVQADSACGYGIGTQGTWNSPTDGIWFNGDVFDSAIPHELGHNLGLQHASSMKCNGTPMADDPSTCTTGEYDDPVDIMGNQMAGHMISSEKWYLGWFGGCNAVRVKASGTFNLFPIENPCNGIQALQIPMPKTTRKFTTDQSTDSPTSAKFYYLEYRRSIGLDTGVTAQVMVHISDEIHSSNSLAARNAALDMKPSTAAMDGMQAGNSFTDPAGGVTFKVDSMDATKAVISVTLSASSGSSTCMDGTTLQGSGPDSCSGVSTGGSGGSATGGSGGGGATGNGGATGSGGTSGNGGATGGAGATGQRDAASDSRTGQDLRSGDGSTGGDLLSDSAQVKDSADGVVTSSGGSSSSGGNVGAGGAIGSGGAAGSAGASGGSAGASATGSGGQSSKGGGGGTSATGGTNAADGKAAGGSTANTTKAGTGQSGCSCAVGKSASSGFGSMLLLVGLAMFGVGRHRRTRR